VIGVAQVKDTKGLCKGTHLPHHPVPHLRDMHSCKAPHKCVRSPPLLTTIIDFRLRPRRQRRICSQQHLARCCSGILLGKRLLREVRGEMVGGERGCMGPNSQCPWGSGGPKGRRLPGGKGPAVRWQPRGRRQQSLTLCGCVCTFEPAARIRDSIDSQKNSSGKQKGTGRGNPPPQTLFWTMQGTPRVYARG
jgi:hypothetical protein